MVLLFRGSRDGWKPLNFHSKCDNQGPTITFIKTSLGRLCGGFTPLPWDSTSKWKKDPSKQSFLFSLDSQTVYPLTDPQYTSGCHSSYGPVFGGLSNHNLSAGYQSTDLNTPNVSHCAIGNNYSIPADANGNSVLTGEKNTFTCADIEVYAVKY